MVLADEREDDRRDIGLEGEAREYPLMQWAFQGQKRIQGDLDPGRFGALLRVVETWEQLRRFLKGARSGVFDRVYKSYAFDAAQVFARD